MIFKNKPSLVIVTGLTMIILSNITGHFAPPFSIMATPVLMTAIIAVLNSSLYEQNYPLTVIYNLGLLVLNDLFMRCFAGGYHDREGQAWIFLYSTVAFAIALLIMIIYAITAAKKHGKIKQVLMNWFILLLFTSPCWRKHSLVP